MTQHAVHWQIGAYSRLIIVLIGLISMSQRADADTLTVVPGGEISSIGRAVSKAGDGDLIQVFPGVYREAGIVIDKRLRIVGIDFPVVDGDGMDDDIIQVKSDGVVIEGLHIRNVKTNYIRDLAGINVSDADSCVIRNNRLTNTFFGVYLQKSSASVILGNQIMGQAEREASSGNALHLWKCRNALLENNTVRKHRDGIYIEFTDSTTIRRNVSEGNLRYGLHFMFSSHNDYLENTFRSNGAGVAVMFSKDVAMKRNLFENNWGGASYGMLLKDITDSEISGNRFRKNTVGIYGESASRLNLSGNDFEENGWAMRISGSCRDNDIYGNNFIANTFDVSSASSGNPNIYRNNYWSSYTGYDMDRDGVGDKPFYPVSLFCYLAERVPESIILQRSLFVHMINFAEKVAPALTPEKLKDESPLMKRIKR